MTEGYVDRSLSSVEVKAWSSNSSENNCWWNIAKNQLSESATTQEIADLSARLQEYNNQKNETIAQHDLCLNEGDEIFLPLDIGINGISNNIQEIANKSQTAIVAVDTATANLESANTNLQTAQNALQTAQNAANNAGDDADESITNALNQAQSQYDQALAKQTEAQTQLETAQAEYDASIEEMQAAQTQLEEIKAEYADEQEEYQTELEQIESMLANITEDINIMQQQLETAQAEAEAQAEEEAWASKEVENSKLMSYEGNIIAKVVNYTDGTNARFCAKGTDENNNAIFDTVPEYSKTPTNTEYLDGGRTKAVTYDDGSYIEFYKDDNGAWQQRGWGEHLTEEETNVRSNYVPEE